MSIESLRNFYNSSIYCDRLNEIRSTLGLEEVSDAFPDVLYSHDAKKIEAANVSLESITDCLKNDFDFAKTFIVTKFRAVENEEPDDEHPPNEPPGEDEKAKLIQKLPPYKNFLIFHIVEYLILRDKPEALQKYLKQIRIPHAEKYAKQLRDFYRISLTPS